MAPAAFPVAEKARSAVRRAMTAGAAAAAPLRSRLGTRATRVYAGLVVLVVAFNVVSFFYSDQILHGIARLGEWLPRHASPTAEVTPEEPALADSVTVRDALPPAAVFSPPRAPYSPLASARVFEPPYVVSSADTFARGGTRVRLAFVDGIASDDVCMNEFLAKNPCGLMARASMQTLIANQVMRCRPIFYRHDDIRYQCFSGETDVAAFQVREGFAKPDAFGWPRLSDALAEARHQEKGAWKGGWQVMGRSTFQRNNVLLNKLDALATGRAGAE